MCRTLPDFNWHARVARSLSDSWASCQVKDKISAVLISEIQRFLLPGTHIMSDAMKFYRNIPEYGFVYEFVNSKDTTVHTQNVEVRNRWTKS